MNIARHAPSEKSQQMLDALSRAVGDALEKKRRLGQYAVFWKDGKPVMVGEDAPEHADATSVDTRPE